jgi:hypothetical protein
VVTLADLQSSLSTDLSIERIAEDLRATAAQLVLITAVECDSQARNLVSAELLAELLRDICLYCNARGWSANRVISRAAQGPPWSWEKTE